ncbi:hypothetical protein KR093_008846 [Drosophila rubida]|uniref:23 kDa integral membrane protein n=1 Tax=Drosophila rubida TaxID=30044 RepID=A0AAD4PM12_9MUSC|nr:hypothetical protein KR093_008846 [Drosophila rubida]
MEKTFAITPWKYALLTTCILISALNVLFFSCGVVTWGASLCVYGGYAVALLGASIFAAAFLGVYVSLKESYKYSIYYLISTVLVMTLLTAYFFTFISLKDTLLQQFDDRVKRLFAEKSVHDDTMQPIHSLFRCCGLDGPQDYLSKEQGALPASCCYSSDCTKPSHINEEGCATKAPRFLLLQAEINYYTSIVIFILQILSLFVAFFMGKARKLIKTKDDETPINEN